MKRITYYSKRLPELDKPPQKCTDKELKKITERYTDYFDALCSEDGYVNTYDRETKIVSPWFEEYEKRAKKLKDENKNEKSRK